MVEKGIRELEGRVVTQIIQSEGQKEKDGQSLRDLWDTIMSTNTAGRKDRKGQKEEVNDQNLPNVNEKHLHIQESQ